MSHYLAPAPEIWSGRIDNPDVPDSYRLHQVVNLIDLRDPEFLTGKTDLAYCLLGFCCEEGILRNQGRPGAKEGPAYIRKALATLPARFGQHTALFDAGDIVCEHGDLEGAQQDLSTAVALILRCGMIPIVLGGGHELAFGHFNGILTHLETRTSAPRIGILNFDAHFDLRPYPDQGNSGTSFLQIADQCKRKEIHFSYMALGIQPSGNTNDLFRTADQLGVTYLQASDLAGGISTTASKQLHSFIEQQDHLYLSICADGFGAAHAPGVSAPQPLGMDPQVVLSVIREIIRSEKVIGFDFAEVSPPLDLDGRTTRLAAQIIWEMMMEMQSL